MIRTPAQRAAAVDRVATPTTRKFFEQAERIHDADQIRARLAGKLVPPSPPAVWSPEVNAHQVAMHDRAVRVSKWVLRRLERADALFAAEPAPISSIDWHIQTARKEMGEARWAELNREWSA